MDVVKYVFDQLLRYWHFYVRNKLLYLSRGVELVVNVEMEALIFHHNQVSPYIALLEGLHEVWIMIAKVNISLDEETFML